VISTTLSTIAVINYGGLDSQKQIDY